MKEKVWKVLERSVISTIQKSRIPLNLSAIADETGLDRRTVSKIVNKLEKEEKIKVINYSNAKIPVLKLGEK